MIRDKESQVIETMIWSFCPFHPVGEWKFLFHDASLRQKGSMRFIDSILRNASCKKITKTNVLYEWNEYYILIR